MPRTLSVRRYRPADADAVWTVHEAALRASPLPFVEEAAVDEDVTGVETHYLDAGGEFLVGEVGRDDGADGEPDRDDGEGCSDDGEGCSDDSERDSDDGERDSDDGDSDDVIVAIGGYRPLDDSTVEIRRMRVHPDHQRQGYARRLLSALETRARAAGFETAELETVGSLRAAQALYEDAGYQVVSEAVRPETGDARYTYRRRL